MREAGGHWSSPDCWGPTAIEAVVWLPRLVAAVVVFLYTDWPLFPLYIQSLKGIRHLAWAFVPRKDITYP